MKQKRPAYSMYRETLPDGKWFVSTWDEGTHRYVTHEARFDDMTAGYDYLNEVYLPEKDLFGSGWCPTARKVL